MNDTPDSLNRDAKSALMARHRRCFGHDRHSDDRHRHSDDRLSNIGRMTALVLCLYQPKRGSELGGAEDRVHRSLDPMSGVTLHN